MPKREDRRRVYFIEKKFQIRFILKFCTLVITGSLLVGALMYFLSQRSATVVFENTRATVKSTADFLLPLLIQTIIVVSVIVAISTAILTFFISHKIAGPLYRLKKELNAVGFGQLAGPFSLRKDDQLQDVANSMSEMVKVLRDRILNLRNDWCSLKDKLQALLLKEFPSDLKQEIEALKNIMVQIDKNLGYFKI